MAYTSHDEIIFLHNVSMDVLCEQSLSSNVYVLISKPHNKLLILHVWIQ